MRISTRVVFGLLLGSAGAFGMTPAQGFCEQGGATVMTGNKPSVTKVQQSFPSCTVTVYLNGTMTLAAIYSDNSSTPLANPFSANTKGYWEFYSADGRYDVRLSGTGIGTPFLILRDVVLLSSGGGGGGTPGGSTGQCQWNNSGSFGGITGCTTSGSSVTLTSPTFVTPVLGTPASGIGTNLTGIPPAAFTAVQGNGTKVQLSTGTTTTNNCVKFDANGNTVDAGSGCGAGGTPAFSGITSGTNTAATMLVGSGASLVRSGTGIVDANQILSTVITGISGMVKMTAGIPSQGTSGTDYVGPTTATSYTAGMKQTFSQSATTAGLNFGILTNDPSSPAQGDIWYNSGILMFRDASSTRTIVTQDNTQTLSNKTLTTPTIASFVNATHTHQSAAGGGSLDAAAIGSGLLPVARGGSGSGSPSLVAGTGVSIAGSWPNQTVSATPATGCSPVGVSGTVQASNGSSGCQATALTDDGTKVSSSEPIVAPGFSTGTSAPTVDCSAVGNGGCFALKEGTAPGTCPASAVDCVYSDATQHGLLANFNSSSYLPIVLGPASSTSSDLACWNAVNGGVLKDCTALPSTTTATTQSALDNSTKVATTAYVDRAPSFAVQTDGATVTWAIASAPRANGSLTFTTHGGSRTLNITGLVNGGLYQLKLKQDGTGGEGLTLGTGCTWLVSGGGSGAITPSTGAGAVDLMKFSYDGTNCLLDFSKNYN